MADDAHRAHSWRPAEAILLADSEFNILAVSGDLASPNGGAPLTAGDRLALLELFDPGAAARDRLVEDIVSRGGWSGEVRIRNRTGAFDSRALTIKKLEADGGGVYYAGLLRHLDARAERDAYVDYLTRHDFITELPNRSIFIDRLQMACLQCKRSDQFAGLLFVDIDGIKAVNHSFGYSVGDELLREAAHRLRRATRQADTVARLWGPKFAIIVTELERIEDVEIVASNLLRQLKQEFVIDGRGMFVAANIGVALLPKDGDSAQVLLKNAVTAAASAKQAGLNLVRFSTAELNTRAARRIEIEQDLRMALERREFHLLFHPIIDVDREEVLAAEVLLRWKHPRFGVVGPDLFLDVAEESGLIVDIGEFVFDRVVAMLARLRDDGIPLCQLAVNISAKQLRNTESFVRLADRLQENALPSSLIELEIAEAALRESARSIQESIEAINSFGIGLAVDDFGAGSVSLRMLKKYQINSLRIDRIFLADELDGEDGSLVAAMIALANALRIPIVGKGVEAEKQLRFLRSHGCNHIQGYLLGLPLEEDRLAQFLTKPQLPFPSMERAAHQ